MSQTKIDALIHQYHMAYFTPLWAWLLLVVVLIAVIIGICVWEHNISKDNMLKIHPHADGITATVVIFCLFAIVISGICMLTDYSNKSTDHNAMKLCYVERAIQYKNRIPKQKKQIKENRSFTEIGTQTRLQSKIRYEQKFYHKYRNLKGLHGPKSNNYTTHLDYLYNDKYTPKMNYYHFVRNSDD